MKTTASALLVVPLLLILAACGGSSQPTQQQPPPITQFTVGAIPETPLMTPGSSFATTILAVPLVGTTWTGVIQVTMSALPPGLTATPASFQVDTATQNGNVPVTFTAASSLSTGVYLFTVTGTSGTMISSVNMAIAVVPPAPQATSLPANVLYSFTGLQDGGDPSGALISDSAGNLYGTAMLGGAYGPGVVFELALSNGVWQETVLHSFGNGTDGAGPIGDLVFDTAGNLYGATRSGGTGPCSEGCGTIYELSPAGSGWLETVLHDFTGGADGDNPATGVVFDKAGNLYGTAEYGGTVTGANCSTTGCGTVFTLTRSANAWVYSVIYRFQGSPDGSDPGGGNLPGNGLAFDAQGNLYGTTYGGGSTKCPQPNPYSGGQGCGVVFKMTFSGGAWQETLLHTFQATYDGFGPSGLLVDPTGNLYGTTYGGFSTPECNDNGSCGNLYELTASGTLTQLYYFMGGNLGYAPSDLIRDQAGNFYGVASGGPPGCDFNLGCGTVFQLSPTGQVWSESAFHDLPGGTTGWWPNSLTMVGGKLYGTTSQGGVSNYGVIFEVSP